MSKSAVVIGGSLAGLLHGIMLQDNGFTVTILEQDVNEIRKGSDTGISVGPEVLKCVQQYNCIDSEYSIPARSWHFIKKDGSKKREKKTEIPLTNWTLLAKLLRKRFDGHDFGVGGVESAQSTPKVKFRAGARVTDLNERENDVIVHFDDLKTGTSDSVTADIVVAADGSYSKVRSIVAPETQRKYAGYVIWRGTVREDLIEEKHQKVFHEKVIFYLMDNTYALVYIIPDDDGNIEKGKRFFNWCLYDNLADGSKELQELMTDINGKLHPGTVPRGLVNPDLWEKQKAAATSKLPDCISTLLKNTKSPIVSKIYDVVSAKAVFFGGKVFMVGDALATFRPNIAQSTNQAAYDCRLLEQVVKGNMTAKEWERAVLKFAKGRSMLSVVVSTFGLGTRLALLWSICKYVALMVGLKLGIA